MLNLKCISISADIESVKISFVLDYLKWIDQLLNLLMCLTMLLLQYLSFLFLPLKSFKISAALFDFYYFVNIIIKIITTKKQNLL